MTNERRFYVYAYLREDGTPYYIGRGTRGRIDAPHTVAMPTKARRIKLVEGLTTGEADELEVELIAKYGRKNNGTGILRNLTDGGEGAPGYKHTAEAIERISSAKAGVPRSEACKAKLSRAHAGKTLSAGHKRKIGQAVAGIPRTQAQLESVVKTNQERQWTEAMLAKRSSARVVNTARKHGICPLIYASIPQQGRSTRLKRLLKRMPEIVCLT